MSSVREMVGVLLFIVSLQGTSAGLLGAGEGEGSCSAAPYRAHYVQWTAGCPAFAPCCSEFGYCRPLAEWEYGEFRDCNGVSNGTPLPPEILAAEEAAGPYQGKPAGEVGPPPDTIKAHHPPPPHQTAALVHSPPLPHHLPLSPPLPHPHQAAALVHHTPAPQHHHQAAALVHHAPTPAHHHQAAAVVHHAPTPPHHHQAAALVHHAPTPPHHHQASALVHHTPAPPHHHQAAALVHQTPAALVHHATGPQHHHQAIVHHAPAPQHHHQAIVHHTPAPQHHHQAIVHHTPAALVHHTPAPPPHHQAAVQLPHHVTHGLHHPPPSHHHPAATPLPHHVVHQTSPLPHHLTLSHTGPASGPVPFVHSSHLPIPVSRSPGALHTTAPVLITHHEPLPVRPQPQPENFKHSTDESSPVSNLHGDINQPSLVSVLQLRVQPVAVRQDSRSSSTLQATPTVSSVELRKSKQVTPAPAPSTEAPPPPSSPPPPPVAITTSTGAPSRGGVGRQPKLLETQSTFLGNDLPLTLPNSAPSQGNKLQSEIIKPQTRPRVIIPQSDGQCQHPKGGGSYTCISFGAPHKPIFAFHTVQDQDGFFFGSGSGFDPESKKLAASEDNSIDSVRRARKVRVHREFLEKLNKLRGKQNRTSRVTTYDFNSIKKKRMATFPTINGLPITAYQQRLLSLSEGAESSNIQRYEYRV